MRLGVGRDWFGLTGFDPGPRRREGGVRFYLLEEVGSTSDFLLGRGGPGRGRLCRWDGWGWQAGPRGELQPPRQPLASAFAVARRQTAGRGRQGRSWLTEGLALSWLTEPLSVPAAARLAVWTGLVAAVALRRLTGLPLRLKWPNDLYLDGRKTGGVLLDRTVTGADVRLVVGLGLNVGRLPAALPPELRPTVTALPPERLGRRPLAAAAGAILRLWDAELPRFLADGWPAWRDLWREFDLLTGRRVVVRTGEGERAGTVRGIDDGGALLLETTGGEVVALPAGDVHLGAAASAAPAAEGSES